MSVYSVDHNDDRISDPAYKGYNIDQSGEVTEYYDHRDEDPAPSSYTPSSFHQPLVPANGHTSASSKSQPPIKVVKQNAG